jgi:hypothetical protein
VAFITDYAAVDRAIDHLKLRFLAEKPPPSHVIEQGALMAAEGRSSILGARRFREERGVYGLLEDFVVVRNKCPSERCELELSLV